MIFRVLTQHLLLLFAAEVRRRRRFRFFEGIICLICCFLRPPNFPPSLRHPPQCRSRPRGRGNRDDDVKERQLVPELEGEAPRQLQKGVHDEQPESEEEVRRRRRSQPVLFQLSRQQEGGDGLGAGGGLLGHQGSEQETPGLEVLLLLLHSTTNSSPSQLDLSSAKY